MWPIDPLQAQPSEMSVAVPVVDEENGCVVGDNGEHSRQYMHFSSDMLDEAVGLQCEHQRRARRLHHLVSISSQREHAASRFMA